jgi:hypothetical protein
MIMTVDRFQIPRWECLSLLESEPVGRICILDRDYPIALPVNYRMVGPDDERQVVIRTGPETMLGRYSGPSSLEVDHIDLASQQAWSVLVCGRLHHEPGAHGLPDPHPWLDNRHHWVMLTPSTISGRRFVGTPSSDGYSVDWELGPA